MGLESPISTLFDSNGTEMAYSQSQAITTGTTTGYLVMGSGSNGVASIKLGRRFIGCEIDIDYFNEAQNRILKQEEQRSLF